VQPLTILVAAIALAACSTAEPHTAEVRSRAVPDGSRRLCVLREKQTIYSFLPVEISVDGRPIGTLRSGTYLATDLPPGAHGLTVAALNFSLFCGQWRHAASAGCAGLLRKTHGHCSS
jgi:hypothetical protein